MPKYLLQLRKTSFFWIFCNSDISFGSNKASSPVEATWHPITQGLTAEHGCWEPGLWLWRLSVHSLLASLWHVANLLLLCNSLSLVFAGWTRSSSLNHLFPFLLLSLLWISRFRSDRLRRLRSMGRRLQRRKRKFRLSRLPRCTSSWLVLYQLH